MQQALPPSPFDSFNDLSSATTVEELLITHENGPEFVHKLNQSVVTIGRDNSSDIVLNVNGVSRNHVRLEWQRGLWYVIDLGSTNGTLLGGKLLPPNSTHIWPLNQTLKIAGFGIQLRRGFEAEETADRTEFLLPDQLDPDVQALREAFEPAAPIRFTANMWPMTLRNMDRVCVAIQNEASSADTFTLRMSGDAGVAFSMQEWQSMIPAGLERRQTITVAPQKRPLVGSRKTYRFGAELSAENNGKRKLEGELTVDPIMSVRVFMFLMLLLAVGGAGAYYAITNFL